MDQAAIRDLYAAANSPCPTVQDVLSCGCEPHFEHCDHCDSVRVVRSRVLDARRQIANNAPHWLAELIGA